MAKLGLIDRGIYQFVGAMLVLYLFGCASVPPPRPLEKGRSIVAIEITVRKEVFRFITYQPDKVYFVRANDSDDVMIQDRVIPSNYTRGDYFYLVNARPGRYAAVATWRREVESGSPPVPGSYTLPDTTITTYTVFLSKDAIGKTEVVVPPSSIVFSGSFVIDYSQELSDADDAQSHYAKIISPRGGSDIFELLWSDEHNFVGRGDLHEIKHDKGSERAFLKEASEVFKDSEWINLIHHRIGELDSSLSP